MANKKGVVWVDLTDMLVWRGSFTGIQRVTYEYAKRFSSEGARFCAYDEVDNRFFEVSLDFIEKVIAHTGEPAPELITLRKKMRLIIGKPYYMLPDKYKQPLRPLVKSANHAVRYVMSKTITRTHPVDSPYQGFPEAAFGHSDTVALIGAGWNEPKTLTRLIELKQDRGFRIVQHLNDILPIYQPQLFCEELPKLFSTYVHLVVHNVDMVTVISEATKRDVDIYCREQGVKRLPVRVVRLGDDATTTDVVRPVDMKESERFIFVLGTFEVRKNYTLLYQALKLAQIEGRDLPKIVIAGRKGWLSSDILYIIEHDPYMKEKLVWISNVSDSELNWLFENCLFTVFPSIAEGWGLPIVESLQHGKFSLVSGASSMLEIGKGLVDYFLPYDARECMEKMQYYIAEDRYKKMNKKVSKEYEVFTWDASFEQLKDAIGR